MRHFAYTLLAALLLCLQAGAQDRPDRQELSVPGGSTMILLGDPQGYEKYDINQGIFEICTAWIRDNVEHLGIKAVLCTGDLVEQNDNNALDRRMLNQTSRQMWESVSRAFERLDGVVPYITSPATPCRDGSTRYWSSAPNSARQTPCLAGPRSYARSIPTTT